MISMLINPHFEQFRLSPECGHGAVSKDSALDSQWLSALKSVKVIGHA